jgi:hypothetical protein
MGCGADNSARLQMLVPTESQNFSQNFHSSLVDYRGKEKFFNHA